MQYIFIVNSIFQLILSVQIGLNIGNNIEKYLMINNNLFNHLIILTIQLFNILLLIPLIKNNMKKLDTILNYKFLKLNLYYLISISLASIWLIMFISATISEHYKLFTPLLILVSLIELKRSQEFKNE